MLFVRCHRCDQPFPSGIAPSTSTPGGVEILNVLERCPSCSDEGLYNTHEYFFPSAGESTSKSSPTPPPTRSARLDADGGPVVEADPRAGRATPRSPTLPGSVVP